MQNPMLENLNKLRHIKAMLNSNLDNLDPEKAIIKNQLIQDLKTITSAIQSILRGEPYLPAKMRLEKNIPSAMSNIKNLKLETKELLDLQEVLNDIKSRYDSI